MFEKIKNAKLLFKAKEPELAKYIGKKVSIDGKKIEIKKIVGNRFNHTFYEINDEHLIGMLRFHAQMLGDKSITEEQFRAFEQMDIRAEKKDAPKTEKEVLSGTAQTQN
jgi:hypothetical protein